MLNLPIYSEIPQGDNVLVMGAGGGFDVYAGLPLFHTLRERKCRVYLANYSFSNFSVSSSYDGNRPNVAIYCAQGNVRSYGKRGDKNYFPEGALAEFLKEKHNHISERQVFCIEKLGVKPVREAIDYIVKWANIDSIILIDGGVDSLMQGDEEGTGTLLEDTVSMAAVRDANVKNKFLATIGFGTEIEDGVCHYRVLENVAELIKDGGFYGSCSLYAGQKSFEFMREAYDYALKGNKHAASHIIPKIIRAASGSFSIGKAENVGYPLAKNTTEFINPLMSQYWFFSLAKVAMRNILIDSQFCRTNLFTDVSVLHRQKLANLTKRPNSPIPL